MAQIDYFGIQEGIQTQLQNSLTTGGVLVEIEPPCLLDVNVPHVGIFLNKSNREAKFLSAAGTQSLVNPEFEITCVQYNMEEMKEACRLRDLLVKEVEEVLLLDRTLQSTVTTSQLENEIEFDTTQNEGFYAGASIKFTAQLRG